MADHDSKGQVEKHSDFEPGPAGIVEHWCAELKMAQKEMEEWNKRVDRIIKRYRDERSTQGTEDTGIRKFNVLWSNMQTLQPATFMNVPKPVVERRFLDKDSVGRTASEIMERCLIASLDMYDFKEMAKRARDDFLLAGRGAAWVRYVPTFGDLQKDGDGNEFRPVAWEQTLAEFISYKDFLHQPAPYWARVGWVAKRAFMNHKQLVDRFGKEIADKVPLKDSQKNAESATEGQRETPLFKRAPVWEIWDKDSGKAYWINTDLKDMPLDVKDDPLHLEDFFPCPRPIYGTTAPDSLVPIPDYYEYQDQALELDDLTGRIHWLTKALKVVGVYNAAATGLDRMLSEEEENKLIPVAEWPMLAESGGLKGNVDFLPIQEIQAVLTALIQIRREVKSDLYEISGISDVMRGESAASESATAQKIKGQFGTLRLQDKQEEISRFMRDLIKIKAEIIAEHFQDDTIRVMSGYDQLPENDPEFTIPPTPPQQGPPPQGGGAPMGVPPESAAPQQEAA